MHQLGAQRVDAFDIDPKMLSLAARRFRQESDVHLWLGDARTLPVGSGVYDAVLDFGTLYLIAEWRRVVVEIARVLRPGGKFLFEIPACALTRLRNPLVTRDRRVSAIPFGRSFVREIEVAGFTVRHSRLRFAGSIQLAGDLVGVATRSHGHDGDSVS